MIRPPMGGPPPSGQRPNGMLPPFIDKFGNPLPPPPGFSVPPPGLMGPPPGQLIPHLPPN